MNWRLRKNHPVTNHPRVVFINRRWTKKCHGWGLAGSSEVHGRRVHTYEKTGPPKQPSKLGPIGRACRRLHGGAKFFTKAAGGLDLCGIRTATDE